MNVSLSPEHKAFVKAQVRSGQYRNDSEVVRAALRVLEERAREQKLEALLIEGLESGEPIAADQGFWEELRSRVIKRSGQPDRNAS